MAFNFDFRKFFDKVALDSPNTEVHGTRVGATIDSLTKAELRVISVNSDKPGLRPGLRGFYFFIDGCVVSAEFPNQPKHHDSGYIGSTTFY